MTDTPELRASPHRFAIIGNGAISRELRRRASEYPTLTCVGVLTRPGAAEPGDVAALTLTEALERADTIVEAAGVSAVGEYGPAVVTAGRGFLVASVGAFARPAVRERVLDAGPGRTLLTSGAIGGLDLIAAAGRTGGLDRLTLTTRKHPRSLVQGDTPAVERERLLALTSAEELFAGTVTEAIEQFPASLNVAVALGLAAGSLDLVRVRLLADPEASLTEHAIDAVGQAGEYHFRVRNEPLPEHPSSSGLTVRSLLSELLALADQGPRLA